MAFWRGEKLLANKDVVSDFSDDRVDVNAYNLSIGSQYFRTAEADVKEPRKTEALSPGEYFVIPPGQFAFLLTKEKVNVPTNAMAFISIRTYAKFRGLINVSGFHVDPGYNGHLVFGLYNAGSLPMQLREGDRLFKIWFADLDDASSMLFVGQPVNTISNEMVNGMSKEIYSLQSLAQKIRDLEATLDMKLAEQKLSVETKLAEQKPTIDSLQIVWRTIVLGVIGAIIVAILVAAWPVLNEVVHQLHEWIFPAAATTTPPPPPNGT